MLGRDHPDTANSLNNLAGLLQDKGEYEGAEPLFRRALDIRERVLGRDHPDTARSLNNLALLLQVKGEYEKAGPMYKRALKIMEKSFGQKHPSTRLFRMNIRKLYFNLFMVTGFFLFCVAIGVGLGLWLPWLWIIGAPLILFGILGLSRVIKHFTRWIKKEIIQIQRLYKQTLEIWQKVYGKDHIR